MKQRPGNYFNLPKRKPTWLRFSALRKDSLPSESIYLIPPQTPPEKHGPLDEAPDLLERMAGEAARQSRLERKKAKSRGPVTRILLALTIAASLIAAVTMFYGIYYFPDAPIRQTAGGFVGKGGCPRTQEDFEAFLIWKKTMLFVFPSVFVFGLAFGITEARQRRTSTDYADFTD